MQIVVTFKSKSFVSINISSNLNDKLETVIIKYSSKINKDLKSLAFLYNAKLLINDDFKKTLNQIIIAFNKVQKKMCIVVFENNNNCIDINDNNTTDIDYIYILFLFFKKYDNKLHISNSNEINNLKNELSQANKILEQQKFKFYSLLR